MLIQNVSGNSVPAPTVNYGNTGTPVISVPAPQNSSASVESAQTAQSPVASQPTASQPTASQPTASQPTASQPTASQPTASQPTAQPTNAQIQSAVDKVNQAMLQANTGVEFSIDSSSKHTIVKVIDTTTGGTIKQFPSKEMIAISASIDQFQKGLLLSQKA